jgi:hypothetical protein
MRWFKDIHGRQIRLTDEREEHIEADHPEMSGQIGKLRETLWNPDKVFRSFTDPEVELFYKYYNVTPVTEKYLCVVVKVSANDLFIITTYFTDTMKRGEVLWQRK